MKTKLLQNLSVLLVLFFLLGCRNESLFSTYDSKNQEEEFFAKLSQSLSNNPDGKKIIERIKKENQKNNFIEKINKWNGEAKFDQKILKKTLQLDSAGKSEDSTVYLNIPFGNNEYLSSVLFIEFSSSEFSANEIDNMKLEEIVNDESLNRESREKLLINYLILDKSQYNTNEYINIPSTLFPELQENPTTSSKSFKILNYTFTPTESTSGLVGEGMFCIEYEDSCTHCGNNVPTTHWMCYGMGGGGTGDDDGGGTGTGGETGNGDNSGGGGGDGTGTGNGNPENTDPCTDPNNPWYTHSSCGNSTPISVINLIQKVNYHGYNIAEHMQFLTENPSIRIGLSSYLNSNDNQQGAQFVNWGLQFLSQNQNITWSQFQNWFMETDNPSSIEMQDFLSDLNNPDIVKPTLRLKNNVRLNCIFNKAKTSANFKQYLTNFDSRFSVAHLLFDVKSLSNSTANAQTSPPDGYWIKITINSNNLNRPTLDIARTFMHEIIHAEMFRILLSLAPTSNGQIDIVQLNSMLNSQNCPGIYDYYRRFGVNNMQHEQMAAHFRGIIKNYLKHIDSSITDSQAESMAWVGLQGTVAWNNLGTTNQTNILNTYNNWYNSATRNCP